MFVEWSDAVLQNREQGTEDVWMAPESGMSSYVFCQAGAPV